MADARLDLMILAELSLLGNKIWNRGVDIIAGVATSTISAAIIALIAIWTWRWKRKRDLKHEEDKQRQQYAIAEELCRNLLAPVVQEARNNFRALGTHGKSVAGKQSTPVFTRQPEDYRWMGISLP